MTFIVIIVIQNFSKMCVYNVFTLISKTTNVFRQVTLKIVYFIEIIIFAKNANMDIN